MIDPILVLFAGVLVLVILREMTPRRLDIVQTDGALQLQPDPRRRQLDLGTVGLGLLAGLVLWLSPPATQDRPFGSIFAALMVARAIWALAASWNRFPVRIDRTRDEVQSGRQVVGSAQSVIQVEFTGRRRHPVALVFPQERGQWRWEVPGVPASQAGELGRTIADFLQVPFRNVSRS